jgi:hypothetical protein
MDNPEEAGVRRWRCVPLRSEAVGRLQNAAGRSAEICTKPPQICNAAVQKTRKATKGADVALRHNASDADAAPLEGAVAAQQD